ncbi:MAG: SBBP repeat-containing protein [Kiritimatiellae bacterium]|nr:SBBP repeat-containing protein [Kiritimatiellia bacterium]
MNKETAGCGCSMVLLAGILYGAACAAPTERYDLSFSTYLGGSNWEHARDVCADAAGNVYVVGGTASTNFPTTPGAFQRTLADGAAPAFGPCDAFIAKFGPTGNLIWATYLGGPEYDRAYAVEVDAQGYVYVAGRSGHGLPVKNAFQPTFDGVWNGSYGWQNAFVAKLKPDGSDLVWASYIGVNTLCRDLAIDADGDVYVPCGRWNTTNTPPAAWFTNAFQKVPNAGQEAGAYKIKGDGSGVVWATWLGGSGDDSSAMSIRVDAAENVYLGLTTFSDDIPTTPGAHDRSYNGAGDFYVAKLNAQGSALVYATYIGGASGPEWISTHNLAVDAAGNAYVAVPCHADWPTTAGAFQTAYGGGGTDWGVAKLSPTGALLASTLIGGNGNENPDGLYVDAAGNVYISGETTSTDFPMVSGAIQNTLRGQTDAVAVRLSSDFGSLLYSTYLGGTAYDNGRSGYLAKDGTLYITGASDGGGWPTTNAYQAAFAGGGGGSWGNGDAVVAKLAPLAVTVDSSATYQTLNGWEATAFIAEPSDPAFPNFKNTVYDLLVDELGINRLRLEIRSGVENANDNWSDYQAGVIDYATWRSRRYATVNDNSDPDSINWAGFHFSEMDWVIDNLVIPVKQRVAANGEKLFINLNYVAFTGQITTGQYHHADPAEYAEFMLAAFLHMQSKYGWVPDGLEIILEPDNVAQWNGTVLGRAIVATAARLAAHGFTPRIIAPSNTNMGNAVTYFDQMIQVPGVLQVLDEFSYHRYSGVSDANLQAIASRAVQHGLDTSMLEWWTGGNTHHVLHKDLTLGRNSVWQEAVVRGHFDIDVSDPSHPTVAIRAMSKFTRQYYKYVRSGAVRIGAASGSAALEPIAFRNADGRTVVVVKAAAAGSFSVQGLPAGTYGLLYTTGNGSSVIEYDKALPDVTIEAGGAVPAGIPAEGVLTLYARSADALPPAAPGGLALSAK